MGHSPIPALTPKSEILALSCPCRWAAEAWSLRSLKK